MPISQKTGMDLIDVMYFLISVDKNLFTYLSRSSAFFFSLSLFIVIVLQYISVVFKFIQGIRSYKNNNVVVTRPLYYNTF